MRADLPPDLTYDYDKLIAELEAGRHDSLLRADLQQVVQNSGFGEPVPMLDSVKFKKKPKKKKKRGKSGNSKAKSQKMKMVFMSESQYTTCSISCMSMMTGIEPSKIAKACQKTNRKYHKLEMGRNLELGQLNGKAAEYEIIPFDICMSLRRLGINAMQHVGMIPDIDGLEMPVPCVARLGSSQHIPWHSNSNYGHSVLLDEKDGRIRVYDPSIKSMCSQQRLNRMKWLWDNMIVIIWDADNCRMVTEPRRMKMMMRAENKWGFFD